jgi:hypothetical protein
MNTDETRIRSAILVGGAMTGRASVMGGLAQWDFLVFQWTALWSAMALGKRQRAGALQDAGAWAGRSNRSEHDGKFEISNLRKGQ